MYGTQTYINTSQYSATFENDVKMYGTQTTICRWKKDSRFENDVKMYGTQTNEFSEKSYFCLRMM